MDFDIYKCLQDCEDYLKPLESCPDPEPCTECICACEECEQCPVVACPEPDCPPQTEPETCDCTDEDNKPKDDKKTKKKADEEKKMQDLAAKKKAEGLRKAAERKLLQAPACK